jgi:hypothetical protein
MGGKVFGMKLLFLCHSREGRSAFAGMTKEKENPV